MPIGSKINIKQNEELLNKTLEATKKLFTKGEKDLCVVVQQKPLINVLPHSIVVTNKRVIKYEPGLLKAAFIDYLWKDLNDVHFAEKLFGAELSFKFENGNIMINNLPKDQAKKIYSIAQEKEEEWIEKKRLRIIEEERAKSGASHIIVGKESGQSNIKSKLLDLKNLLDEGLITQDEYHRKKESILNEI